MSGSFELVLGDLRLAVPLSTLTAKCACLAESQSSPYCVISAVSPEAFQLFVWAIEGKRIEVTAMNVADLTLLSAEFSFAELQREVSAWSLASVLVSECRLFLSDRDNRQARMSPLDRLVSLGFNRTVSHNMLIVVRGNFNDARAALENLSSDPQAMALFASSIPIVKCEELNTLRQFMKELQPRDPSIFEVMYMPAGGLRYAFTRIDLQEYKFCDFASEQLHLQSVVLDDLSNFRPEAVEFYQRRWSPDPEGESTFLMEGLSQVEARTLMKLARGRYLMA
jgi:hypothetical protein